MKTKILTSAAALALSFTSGQSATVDLSTWSVQNFTPGAGNWTVAPGGGSVFQSINGDPTVFLSPNSALGTNIQGKIKVETTGDDDFIGFVLGFDSGDFSNPLADYLLIDWKQANQSVGALDGLAVSRVTGVLPDASGFWDHSELGKITELARGTNLGSTGWADNTEYTFGFVFTPTNLQVTVNGVTEININGSFSGGNLGFYNYSQSSVRYSGFTQDPVPPPTGSVPDGGSALALLGLSLGSLGLFRAGLVRSAKVKS
jgi:hypothetical protein